MSRETEIRRVVAAARAISGRIPESLADRYITAGTSAEAAKADLFLRITGGQAQRGDGLDHANPFARPSDAMPELPDGFEPARAF